MDFIEFLDGLPINEDTMPMVLAFAVNEINKAPIDYKTRLRTYGQFVEALKERMKQDREKEGHND